MNKSLNLFAQLAKIDESRQEVWGVATAEVVDKDGEIFDYASSKPYFEAWSAEIAKATDGKSLGNVREMHVNSAVGKLVVIEFDDALKQISVGAGIMEDAGWQKCAQGVYTGFSIGGQYVKAWDDGEFIRFTAKPAEISVVDNPCVPSAHFTAVKTDGSCEVRKFKVLSSQQSAAFSEIPNPRGFCGVRDTYELSCTQGGQPAKCREGRDPSPAKGAGFGVSEKAFNDKGAENTMLETKDKEQLEKAHAYSASALSKVAEVEKSVAQLRNDMEKNNDKLRESLGNLVQLLEKLVDPQAGNGKVARTTVPFVTVRKEDDGAGADKDR